ncbi:MAG TPA: glycosyltransferase [Gaiellaceae bacterium]|nr:glycosyltransferase [Gaiellaceae bacterium]
MTGHSLLAPAARVYVRARTRGWPEASRLFAVGERTGWSVDEDARNLEDTARRLGYAVAPARWARFARGQAVFLTSHFEALQPRWLETTHRLGTAYLHGRPGTPGYPEFDRAFETLRANPHRFSAIQVTHAEMRDLVLEAGVPRDVVHLIPIGIDIENFPLVTPERRAAARTALHLPADVFVVGSFQKDGVGWGEGLEPKLIKGPDVLVGALELVRAHAPELQVLLTGPARGYVRRELERLDIPYRHVVAESRAELARAYHALDVYVVASRQEGGPKAVLESMATGIPLVTTRVGQAQELPSGGANVRLVDIDAEAVATAVLALRAERTPAEELARAGRITAESHSHERLDPRWRGLLARLLARDA